MSQTSFHISYRNSRIGAALLAAAGKCLTGSFDGRRSSGRIFFVIVPDPGGEDRPISGTFL